LVGVLQQQMGLSLIVLFETGIYTGIGTANRNRNDGASTIH
jgi:hypothetical protein